MHEPPEASWPDPSRHLPLEHLGERIEQLAPPQNSGTLAMIVARQPGDRRQTPQRATLSPEGGMPGDKWSPGAHGGLDGQITMMRLDVARLVANGQPVEQSGDNLLVDLDLSESNLPTGSRLRVGGALLEVTSLPHNGCHKFRARFGDGALRLTADRRWKHLRLRGIYAKVIEAGEVAVGDQIEVVSRAAE